MKQLLPIFIFSLILISCKTDNKKITAQEIVNTSIQNAGLNQLKKSDLNFKLREINYKASRNNGSYNLQRTFINEDSLQVNDQLSNKGFKRFVNNELKSIPDSLAIKYEESVNSVHYFSVLPLGLNDAAVNKEYLGTVTIKGKAYHKVKITFKQEGGGVDFEDVFIYWFRTSDFLLDYLAYSYTVNGGGVRFREVSKEQVVNGVRFVNYKNYKPNDAMLSVENLDKAFDNGQLKLLSEINLENIQLEIPNN